MSSVSRAGGPLDLNAIETRFVELLDEMCATQAAYETANGLIECKRLDSEMALVRGQIGALWRAQQEELRALRTALRQLTDRCEQVAWTNRDMADGSKDGYWSFVPTDVVRAAQSVLAAPGAPEP